MSPRRTTTTAPDGDLLRRIMDKMDRIEDRIAAMEQALERRLAPIEAAPARLDALEARVAALEQVRARAEGAVTAGRAFWGLVTALAAAAGYVLNNLLHR